MTVVSKEMNWLKLFATEAAMRQIPNNYMDIQTGGTLIEIGKTMSTLRELPTTDSANP